MEVQTSNEQSHNKTDISAVHTILYIEDNPANLRLVQQILSRLSDMKMLAAHAPAQGIELAGEQQPDLILLDINLPDMDGYEVLKTLRENTVTRHIPVIAISANAMAKDIESGLEAGFDDYITKPIDVSNLLHKLENTLQKNTRGNDRKGIEC